VTKNPPILRFPAAFAAFAALSAVPFLKAASGLIRYSLSDVPEAYLVVIPVVAYFWTAMRLRRDPEPPRRGLADFWSALLVVGVGGVLALSLAGRFPGYANSPVLLLWPLWCGVTAAFIFGPGAFRHMLRPLLYLYLAWPPVFIAIINTINPGLQRAAFAILKGFGHMVWWMRTLAPGRYAVNHGGAWITANVTQACSGSDSILALLAIFPVVLLLFQSSALRKLGLVVAGSFAAFVFNIGRIVFIFWVIHLWGPYWGFVVVHPLVGPVLVA
jgi:exosortase/archaeosortase family protein